MLGPDGHIATDVPQGDFAITEDGALVQIGETKVARVLFSAR
jgi:hypothetical protein